MKGFREINRRVIAPYEQNGRETGPKGRWLKGEAERKESMSYRCSDIRDCERDLHVLQRVLRDNGQPGQRIRTLAASGHAGDEQDERTYPVEESLRARMRQKTSSWQCGGKMTPTTRMMMTERQKTDETARQNTAGETQDKRSFQGTPACGEAVSGCLVSHSAAEIRQREIPGHEIPDLLRYLALYRWGLLCEGNTDDSCLLMR